jgi:hypothetical protein
LTVVSNAKHAREYADDTADCATQYATDRPGRLVALLGSLLNALNQPLRIHRRRRVEKHRDKYPKRETQSWLRKRGRCRADHYLVSIVEPGIGRLSDFGASN